ncbi:hypothetical protein IEQ34_022068 [Dendrobium chrysotoxum]|uniref:Uncharacterized protein n=2 Tax=Dendrobium chrysotoxum TaxID=161865 RepID=A0AAV7FXW0_DENCH|nr:hypothetical protein IEQ34_022068 [Dendrobium chrysotoxum]
MVQFHIKEDSSKFVSALKGSRTNQGKPLDPNLHVTWAANVYDPPVTSTSHTVRGHRHCLPKAKTLDYHKHKHMKAKPYNANSGDRKHSHRRSSSRILNARMASEYCLQFSRCKLSQENQCRLVFDCQSYRLWILQHQVVRICWCVQVASMQNHLGHCHFPLQKLPDSYWLIWLSYSTCCNFFSR